MSNFIQNIAASLFGLYTKEDVKKKVNEATKNLNNEINKLKQDNQKLINLNISYKQQQEELEKIVNDLLKQVDSLKEIIKNLETSCKKEYTISFNNQDKVYYKIDNTRIDKKSIKIKEGQHTIAAYNIENDELADNLYIDIIEEGAI